MPATRELAVLELDIGLGGFEQVGGDLAALGDDLVHRLDDRRAADGERARAVGAHAEGDLVGVAVDDLDALDRDAEPVGDELGEGRLVPLAVAVRSGEDRDAAGRMDPDLGAFVEPGARAERAGDGRGRDAAGLDIGGDADAAQLAARRRLAAPGLEALIVGGLQRQLERRQVIAAVVLQRDRRLVRIGVLRDEVAAAQLGRIDADLVGREVDDALEQKGRLRTARRRDRRRPARCW